MKSKLCKYCHGEGHTSLMCFNKPRKTPAKSKSISRFGKQAAKWVETKNEWIQQNPPQTYATAERGWLCHYCSKFMNIYDLTLDHKYNRSGHPELRYELSNLLPCCYEDNARKGSTNYDVYCATYYPRLLKMMIY